MSSKAQALLIENNRSLKHTWLVHWGRVAVAALISLLMLAFSSGVANGQSRTVRVGVYQNKPKIFMDENGHASPQTN